MAHRLARHLASQVCEWVWGTGTQAGVWRGMGDRHVQHFAPKVCEWMRESGTHVVGWDGRGGRGLRDISFRRCVNGCGSQALTLWDGTGVGDRHAQHLALQVCEWVWGSGVHSVGWDGCGGTGLREISLRR